MLRRAILICSLLVPLFRITAQHPEPQSGQPTGTVSAIALKAKGQFPRHYVQALRAKGEFPGWANYACFDPDPRLESSYFLLVAYSLKPVNPAAATLGVVKGVTYQEYIREMPLNRPPTIEEVQQQLANAKVGDKTSALIFNMLNAGIQASENLKHTAEANREMLGDTFEGFLAFARAPNIYWPLQKYMNAAQAGGAPNEKTGHHTNPFPTLTKKQFEDELGFVLYELAPGTNQFLPYDPRGQTTIAEVLNMPHTSAGCVFSRPSYAGSPKE